jgi:hypothetical protein
MKAESRKQKAEMVLRGLSRSVASRPFGLSAPSAFISAFCFLLSDL